MERSVEKEKFWKWLDTCPSNTTFKIWDDDPEYVYIEFYPYGNKPRIDDEGDY